MLYMFGGAIQHPRDADTEHPSCLAGQARGCPGSHRAAAEPGAAAPPLPTCLPLASSRYPRYSAAAPSLVPPPGQAGCITSPVCLFSCTSACHTSRRQQLAGARSELSTAARSGCTRGPAQICTAGSLLRARAGSWLCLCAPCPCEPAACSQQESAAGGFSHGSTKEPSKAEHQCRDSSTVISTRGST